MILRLKRAIPNTENSADHFTEVKGGGKVNLRITVRNMHDSKLKEGLPAASGLRWSFEGKPAVRHEQEIKGSDGTYTAAFSVPDENGTVTCRVYMAGNSFYESSEAAVTVQVRKNDKPSGGNKDEGGGTRMTESTTAIKKMRKKNLQSRLLRRLSAEFSAGCDIPYLQGAGKGRDSYHQREGARADAR